jgi:poly-beta-hydroxyalkanoate depolymerase
MSFEIDGKHLPVDEHNVARKPFGQLKHFTYEGSETKPKLLICRADVWPFRDAAARHCRTDAADA